LTWGNGFFLAFSQLDIIGSYFPVHFGRSYTSVDGIHWSFESEFGYVEAVIFANNLFLAFGIATEQGRSFYTTQLRSTNGTSWTNEKVFSGGSLQGESIKDIGWGAGKFVILSFNILGPANYVHYRGSDEFSWHGVWIRDVTKPLNGVAYGDSLFVAVGESGMVYTAVPGQVPTEAGKSRNAVNGRTVAISGDAIRFSLQNAEHVSVNLYTLQGQFVKSLEDGLHVPGVYRRIIPPGIPQGIFILSFKAGEAYFRQKIVIGGRHE
jgi:hypothetical protein